MVDYARDTLFEFGAREKQQQAMVGIPARKIIAPGNMCYENSVPIMLHSSGYRAVIQDFVTQVMKQKVEQGLGLLNYDDSRDIRDGKDTFDEWRCTDREQKRCIRLPITIQEVCIWLRVRWWPFRTHSKAWKKNGYSTIFSSMCFLSPTNTPLCSPEGRSGVMMG